MSIKTYSYLALGDSYTIGEGLPLFESFPYQTIQLLRQKKWHFYAPEIIAKTGWTSFELQGSIDNTMLQPNYDIVSLLIGVNNQYRGLPVAQYATEFELLLQRAITLANNKLKHVFVLSIPNWGLTPFANGKDCEKISGEIDVFNKTNQALVVKYKANYIDVTIHSGQSAIDESLLSDDKLHPSGKEYVRWASLLAAAIDKDLR